MLETNGMASSGKHTKHLNVRFFFVTDKIKKRELEIGWCPTEDMIGDYATKPVQGSLFRKFRDMIMGVVPPKSPSSKKRKDKK